MLAHGLCRLLVRTGFLAPASVLLLAGSLLSDVAVRLQVQSIRNFEYAASEEGAALGAQEQADRAIAQTALDQEEAGRLEADAARLEGVAGGEEVATAEEAGVGEGAVAVGEDGAAEGGVEAVAAQALRGVAAAGEATAAEAAAAGATAAEAGVVAAVVEGGAAAGAAAGGEALGTVAVVSAIALEAPRAVAGAKAEWAAAGEELQAASEEAQAAEKEAEAGALEASVPVYEEGTLLAHRSAAASFATGAGYIATAQLLQLAALALQGPVALVVLAEKGAAVGTNAIALRSLPLALGSMAAGTSLAIAAGAALAGAWARSVVAAAEWGVMQQLARLPDVIARAVPSPAQRRLWALPDVGRAAEEAVEAVAEATRAKAESAAREAQAAAIVAQAQASHSANEVGDAARSAASAVASQAARVENMARARAKQVAAAARAGAMDAAKAVLVRKANTATTTVAPLVVRPPPVPVPHAEFFRPAVDSLRAAALHWAWLLVADVGAISLLFLFAEAISSAGRLLPTARCGCGCAAALPCRLLADAGSGWLRGLSILTAVWATSIVLAADLRDLAQTVEDRVLAASEFLVPAAVMLCAVAHCAHAWLLSKRTPCSCQRQAEEDTACLLGAQPVGWSAWLAALPIAATGAALAAAEGPLCSWALSSAYHSYRSVAWLLAVIPWQHVAPEAVGVRVPRLAVLAPAPAVGCALLGVLLFWARRAARLSDGSDAYPDEDVRASSARTQVLGAVGRPYGVSRSAPSMIQLEGSGSDGL